LNGKIMATTVERLRAGSRPVPRGLTLVEVIVTMSIFIVLAGFTIMAVQQTVSSWVQSERRRVLYERAAGVMDIMATDIRLATTDEQPGNTTVSSRLIGDVDPATGKQRIMFVRAFETGPERALVFGAGDGRPSTLQFSPSEEEGGNIAPQLDPGLKTTDADTFTGTRLGDFKALGGRAAVGYFVQNETLYRAIRAPVPPSLSAMMDPLDAQEVAKDVLYLGFDYWSQETRTWTPDPKEKKYTGPEKIWDSTRAYKYKPMDKFFLHRGDESMLDTSDDVFPEKIRVTLVVDAPMPRAINTTLLQELSDTDMGWVDVDTTRGFADGDDQNSFICIDGEWMRYKNKRSDGFEIVQRGARNTKAASHKPKALIRQGRVFRKVIYLPGWKEDWTPDEVWNSRKLEAQEQKRNFAK
jgi:type II secretory pathway component PulJ